MRRPRTKAPRFALALVCVAAVARAGADGGTAVEVPDAGVAAAAVEVPAIDARALGPVDPQVAVASAALRSGRIAEALKLLEKDASPDAAWIRASALLAGGRKAEAAAAFAKLSTLTGPLATRAACLRATLEPKGDGQREAFEGCTRDPVRGRSARLQLATSLIDAGRGAEAAEALGDLPARLGPARPEAMYLRGMTEELLGKESDALATFRVVFVEEAASPFADRARTRARTLVTKLKAQALPAASLLDRVDRLVTAKRWAAAAADLKELKVAPLCDGPTCMPVTCDEPDTAPWQVAVRSSCATDHPEAPIDADSCRAHMLRAAVARGTRAYPKAVELGLLVYARCEEPDVRARALFLAATSLATPKAPSGPAQGIAHLIGLQFPANPLADDAWMIVAAARREAGDRAGERQALAQILANQPEGDQVAEALFQTFWSFAADAKPLEGAWALEFLARDFDSGPRGDGGDAERGRYWLGKSLLEAGAADKVTDGVARLTSLAKERPLTFYGLLARSLLSDRGHPLPSIEVVGASTGARKLGSLADDGGFRQAVELVRLGLYRDAREVLLALDTRKLRNEGPPAREGIVLIGELLTVMGEFRAAHAVVRRELLPQLRGTSDPLLVAAARIAYPRMFRPFIEAATAPVSLDADLLQGLMREESALDPRALSPVGARGLTQVMVPTGKQVAKTLGIKPFSAESLYDPATNTRIGGWYLAWMLRMFKHPGFAAGAYNAGPGNMGKWLRERPPTSFDAFAEEIPFAETKNYVRRVLRSWNAYRVLYGGAGAVPVVVPVDLGGA